MRYLILELVAIYGANHNAKITNWVNAQVFRETTVNAVSISLDDIQEARLVRVLRHSIGELSLSVDQLVNGTWLVPCLDARQSEFDASLELRPWLFKDTLGSSYKAISEGLIRDGDVFERYMEDTHILHKPAKNNTTKPAIYAYINGKVSYADKQYFDFSCSLSADEIEGVKSTYVKNKFNGVDPFSNQEWEEIFLASVYRRLYDKTIFSAISENLEDSSAAKYSLLSSFGHSRFDLKIKDDETVYCSYGRPIAKKVIRYSAVEAKVATGGKPKPQLKLVSSSKAIKPVGSEIKLSEVESDVQTEWGLCSCPR